MKELEFIKKTELELQEQELNINDYQIFLDGDILGYIDYDEKEISTYSGNNITFSELEGSSISFKIMEEVYIQDNYLGFYKDLKKAINYIDKSFNKDGLVYFVEDTYILSSEDLSEWFDVFTLSETLSRKAIQLFKTKTYKELK